MSDDQWYEYDNAQGNPAQYVIAAYPEGLLLKSLPKAIQSKRHAALLSHLFSFPWTSENSPTFIANKFAILIRPNICISSLCNMRKGLYQGNTVVYPTV